MSRPQNTAIISLLKVLTNMESGKDYTFSTLGVAGNVTTYLDNLDDRFKYVLQCVSVYLDADATAVDRKLQIRKFNVDDIPMCQQLSMDSVASNELGYFHGFPFGTSVIVSSTSPIRCDMALPEIVLEYGEYLEIAIENGCAGDSYDLRVSFKRVYVPPKVYV